jgi:NADH-quinone oxidoreductase subunit A
LSFIYPAQDNDASSGSYDDNPNRWQSDYSLLAGNDLFRRGSDLSGSADCARQVPATNQYEKSKMRPYECGIDPTTEAHERFTVRYYIVAMLFLIFDVETIFLLPWAIIFMGDDFSFTKFALLEMFVFIAILVVGYYYAWRKGALEWA